MLFFIIIIVRATKEKNAHEISKLNLVRVRSLVGKFFCKMGNRMKVKNNLCNISALVS